MLGAALDAEAIQYIAELVAETDGMTMRYASTLASTAEREFLALAKVGRDGRELGMDRRDILDLVQFDRRTDRILPNGYCLLPPTRSCDKGNACPGCDHFATDRTFLPDIQRQLAETKIKKAAQAKSKGAADRAEAGIRSLLKSRSEINFRSVARAGGVSLDFLYNHPDLRRRIETLRSQQQPMKSSTADAATNSNGTVIQP